MDQRVKRGYKFQSGPSQRKAVKNSPYAMRQSMSGVENLPELPTAIKQVMTAAVNEKHYDSSDEDFDGDKNFK